MNTQHIPPQLFARDTCTAPGSLDDLAVLLHAAGMTGAAWLCERAAEELADAQQALSDQFDEMDKQRADELTELEAELKPYREAYEAVVLAWKDGCGDYGRHDCLDMAEEIAEDAKRGAEALDAELRPVEVRRARIEAEAVEQARQKSERDARWKADADRRMKRNRRGRARKAAVPA
jgi:hypothetical protein